MPISPSTDTSSRYPPGSLIASRYEVLSVLGSGSIATVFECKDTALENEIVALKVLSGHFEKDEVTRARFVREVTLGRRLAHPFIIRLFDYGVTHEGHPFISMERVEGHTQGLSLRSVLEQGPCEPQRARELFGQLVEAVAYAHSQGVLHRDIKPDNVLITAHGEVRMTDFGTAKDEVSDQQLTRTGEAVGTPLYMAPEVVKGGRADVRSDLYSLGALGYELATGKPPFQSENWVVLAGMHVSTPAPEIETAGVSERYRDAIARLLEKDPNTRFQSARELLEFLSGGSNQAGLNWGAMAAGLGVGIVLGLSLGVVAW